MTDKLLNLLACIEDSLSVYDSSVSPMSMDEKYDYIITVEKKRCVEGRSISRSWDLSDIQEFSSEFERMDFRTNVNFGGPDVFTDDTMVRHWLEIRVKE